MPVEQQQPTVLTLVIADYIYQDIDSEKLFILGVRRYIGAATFPFTCPALGIYANLVDGRGETDVRVRLVDVDEAHEPVVEFETTVSFADPTEEREILFRPANIVFPEPGDYRLQVQAAGQLLTERRFLVIPLENPDSP